MVLVLGLGLRAGIAILTCRAVFDFENFSEGWGCLLGTEVELVLLFFLSCTLVFPRDGWTRRSCW